MRGKVLPKPLVPVVKETGSVSCRVRKMSLGREGVPVKGGDHLVQVVIGDVISLVD